MPKAEDKAALAQLIKDRKKALNNKIAEVLLKTSFQNVEEIKEARDGAKSLYIDLTVHDRKGTQHSYTIVGGGMADVDKTGKQETTEHFLAELPRRLSRRLKKEVDAKKIKLSREQLKEPYATEIKGPKKEKKVDEEGGEGKAIEGKKEDSEAS